MRELSVRRRPQQRIAIWGAGGHGRVVLDVLRCCNRGEVVCFLDDAPDLNGKVVMSIPVVLPWHVIGGGATIGVDGIIPALGSNPVRRNKFATIMDARLDVPQAVHPTVVISPSVSFLGRGLQAMASVIINPGASVGDNVILNTRSVIEHDCIVEDHCFIGPGVVLGGGVHIGRGAFLGIGTMVKPGVYIGEGTMTGVGAVVVKDLPPGVLAMGVPARPVRDLLLPPLVLPADEPRERRVRELVA